MLSKVFLFFFLFLFNVPVNNFSVMLIVEKEPPFPGYYQYFLGVNVSCSRKQHTDPAKDRLSKVYMLKTCLEIITEKERGMKLFSWIHMFLTLSSFSTIREMA